MKPSELPEWVQRCALDTEDGTIDRPDGALYPDDGARVSDVSVAWHTPLGVVETHAWRFWDAEGHEGFEPLPESEWDALCDWLLRREGIVMHNSLYDCIMMEVGTGNGYRGVDLLDLVCWDTLLVAAFLDPTELTALGAQSEIHLGETDKADTLKPIKQWLADRRRAAAKGRNAENARRRKEGKENLPPTPAEIRYQPWAYYLAPWELVEPYAASDASQTIRLARQQWARLRDGEAGRNPWPTVHHDLEVMRTLCRMERRGLPYDVERSLEVAAKLRWRRVELEAELPFGKPTPTKLKEWFFDRHRVKPLKVSDKTGEPSCDAETIDYMAETDVPGAAELNRYKKVDGAETRWYRPFAEMTGSDGRLRPRYRQTAVRSGRLSIERAQLQAIPHDYVLEKSPELSPYPTPRQCIRPEEGWDLWEMDLAQAELRVAAWMAVAETMLAIIREGRDPHGELASATFGVKKGDDEFFRYRQVGKRGNFSLIFGIGKDKLKADIRSQTGVDLPMPQVMKMIRTFRDMHPEFGRAIDRDSRAAERSRHVTLVNGRQNWFKSFERDLHKAFNRRVQASIGEFAKAWMVDADAMLRREIEDPRHGLLLQIHDSLVMSVPAGESGAALAKRARQIGLDKWDEWFQRPAVDSDGNPYVLSVPGGIDSNLWGQK